MQHANVQVSLVAPRDELVAKCAELEVADKAAERRSGLYGVVGWVCLIGAVGAFFVNTFAAIALLVVGAIMIGMRVFASDADLEDRKLAIPTHLLRTLGPELSPKKPMKLEIDFRAFEKVGLVDRQSGGWGQPVSLTYRHVWLTCHLALANGARVMVEAAINSKRKEKPKRKYTKVKQRTAERLRVLVTPPRGSTVEPSSTLKVGTPAGMTLLSHRIKPRGVEFVYETPESMLTIGRYGSEGGDASLLNGALVLSAIIHSYKIVEKAIEGNV